MYIVAKRNSDGVSCIYPEGYNIVIAEFKNGTQKDSAKLSVILEQHGKLLSACSLGYNDISGPRLLRMVADTIQPYNYAMAKALRKKATAEEQAIRNDDFTIEWD